MLFDLMFSSKRAILLGGGSASPSSNLFGGSFQPVFSNSVRGFALLSLELDSKSVGVALSFQCTEAILREIRENILKSKLLLSKVSMSVHSNP